MESSYCIRPACRRDLGELARMRRALQELLIAGDPNILRLREDRLADSARFYAEVMARPDAWILVAVSDSDVPVAMLMLRVINSPMTDPGRFGRIDDAWVEPEHRRRGIMRRLAGNCVELLKAQDVNHVALDYSVRNPVSEKCWLALVFQPMLVLTFARVDELKLEDSE